MIKKIVNLIIFISLCSMFFVTPIQLILADESTIDTNQLTIDKNQIRSDNLEEKLKQYEIQNPNSKTRILDMNAVAIGAGLSLQGALAAIGTTFAPFLLMGLALVAVGIVLYNWNDILEAGKNFEQFLREKGSSLMTDYIDAKNSTVKFTDHLLFNLSVYKQNLKTHFLDGYSRISTFYNEQKKYFTDNKITDFMPNYLFLSNDNIRSPFMTKENAVHYLGNKDYYFTDEKGITRVFSKTARVIVSSPFGLTDLFKKEGKVLFTGLTQPYKTTKKILSDYAVQFDFVVPDSVSFPIGNYSGKLESHVYDLRGLNTLSFDNMKGMQNVQIETADKYETNVQDNYSEGQPYYLEGRGVADQLLLRHQSSRIFTYSPDFKISSTGIGAVSLPGMLNLPEFNTNDKKVAAAASPGVVTDGTIIDSDGTFDGGNGSDPDSSKWDMLTFLRRIWSFLRLVLNPMTSVIDSILNQTTTIKKMIESQNATIPDIIKTALKDTLSQLTGNVTNLGSSISTGFSELTAKMIASENKVIRNIGEFGDSTLDRFNDINLKITSMFDTVIGVGNDVKNDVGERVRGAVDTLLKTGQSIKDEVGERVDASAKSLSRGIDGVNERISDVTTGISDSFTGALDKAVTNIRDFIVPDVVEFNASLDKVIATFKSRFGFITDIQPSFKKAFNNKLSLYDLRVKISDTTFAPFPISLKVYIDTFRTFLNAVCVLFTILRIYKRFVGEGDAIAT